MSTEQDQEMLKKEILGFEIYDNIETMNLDLLSDIGLQDVLVQPSLLHHDVSPILNDEVTMDAITKYEATAAQDFPLSPLGPPDRDDFTGDLNFTVEVNAKDTNKRKYLYSHKLNRIYVDMKCDFPVQFNWNSHMCDGPMYVRATVVFSDESQAEKRVERCLQHTHESANASLSQTIVKNVLHSSRELHTQGVFYCGQPGAPDSWLSVLVQLPTCGTHAYQFVCKNSCSTGINRRAIEIIFTLEDVMGHVYGRQRTGARVCACPRRDMLRDEQAALPLGSSNKRRLVASTTPDAPRGKKVKLDNDLVTLPQLTLVGVKSVVTGLEVMLSMQEQAASLKKTDALASEKYLKSITELKTAIEQLKSKVTQ